MALIRKVALEEYIAHDAREELLKPQLTMLIAVQSKELLLLEKGRINDVWESNHDGLDKIIDYDFRANAISNRDTWYDK